MVIIKKTFIMGLKMFFGDFTGTNIESSFFPAIFFKIMINSPDYLGEFMYNTLIPLYPKSLLQYIDSSIG